MTCSTRWPPGSALTHEGHPRLYGREAQRRQEHQPEALHPPLQAVRNHTGRAAVGR